MTPLTERQRILALVSECMMQGARQERACFAINLSVRTFQRWQLAGESGDKRPDRVQSPKNKLSMEERQRILDTANSSKFAHLTPSQIVPILADDGVYLASESTFHRVLKSAGQLKHRSQTRPSQVRHKPKALRATAPNQLFSWDITYLPTLIRGVYYYLYLFLDIFSRNIVGWQVYEAESSEFSSELLRDICANHKIAPHQVVLHSDNGSPMKGAIMLATMQSLGVTPSFSRPAVSDDNSYSEALFKTLKYCPKYPQKAFASLNAARSWVESFVTWYNNEHRHSSIAYVTPAQRHAGLDAELLQQRAALYERARALNPLRWSGKVRNWQFVDTVYLNPDKPVDPLNKKASVRHEHAA